jgi:phage tail sheath protein FI
MRKHLTTVTKDLSFALDDGQEIEVVLSAELDWVDNGIGSYEFWGQRCCDTKMEWEVQEYTFTFDGSESLRSELEVMVDEWVETNYDTLADEASELAGDNEAYLAEKEYDDERENRVEEETW